MSDTLANALKGGSLLDKIADPTIVNPLAAYTGAAQTANSIWANRQMQAKQAAGEAFQNSLNSDGTTNQPRFNQNIAAAGPTASLAALDSSQAGLTNAGGEQDQTIKRMSIMTGMAAPLLASGQPISKQQWIDTMMGGLGSHGYSKEQVLQGAANIPEPTPQNPYAVNDWLRGHVTAFINPAQRSTAFGNQVQVGEGDQTTFRNVPTIPPSPGTAPPTLAAPPVPMHTTPGERISPVTGPATATGAPTTQPASDYARSHGIDPVTGQPIPNPAFRNLPPGLRNPNAPPPPVSAPTQTGAGPAATSAMSAGGAASSASYQAVSDAGNKAVSQRALLQGMAADATQFTTGWGADRIKTMKSAVQRIAGMFGLSPIDADKLAANEDLDKVAAQLSDAQGAGSDARLAVNQGANPSSHNSPAGLKLILNKLIGNADYNAAKSQMAAEYQRTQDPTGANARQFEADFRDRFDPRVFQFNRMDGEQQRQYLKELGAGKDKFKLDYIKTKQAGVFPSG
jgi:hypothetical protein